MKDGEPRSEVVPGRSTWMYVHMYVCVGTIHHFVIENTLGLDDALSRPARELELRVRDFYTKIALLLVPPIPEQKLDRCHRSSITEATSKTVLHHYQAI